MSKTVTRYVALLRGINVGGKNLVAMADLRQVVADCGFTEVSTYIQSGNVLFSAPTTDPEVLATTLATAIASTLSLRLTIVVIPLPKLQQVLSQVPANWHVDQDIRCYVVFVKPPTTPTAVADQLHPKSEVDAVAVGASAVYLTTLLSGLTKSGFTKIAGTSVYQAVTIRKYQTVRRIFDKLSSATAVF